MSNHNANNWNAGMEMMAAMMSMFNQGMNSGQLQPKGSAVSFNL